MPPDTTRLPHMSSSAAAAAGAAPAMPNHQQNGVLDLVADLQLFELQLGLLRQQAHKLAADRAMIDRQLQQHYCPPEQHQQHNIGGGAAAPGVVALKQQLSKDRAGVGAELTKLRRNPQHAAGAAQPSPAFDATQWLQAAPASTTSTSRPLKRTAVVLLEGPAAAAAAGAAVNPPSKRPRRDPAAAVAAGAAPAAAAVEEHHQRSAQCAPGALVVSGRPLSNAAAAAHNSPPAKRPRARDAVSVPRALPAGQHHVPPPRMPITEQQQQQEPVSAQQQHQQQAADAAAPGLQAAAGSGPAQQQQQQQQAPADRHPASFVVDVVFAPLSPEARAAALAELEAAAAAAAVAPWQQTSPNTSHRVLADGVTAKRLVELLCPPVVALAVLNSQQAGAGLHKLTVEVDTPPRWTHAAGRPPCEAQLLHQSGLKAALHSIKLKSIRPDLAVAAAGNRAKGTPGNGLKGFFWTAHARMVRELSDPVIQTSSATVTGLATQALLKQTIQSRVDLAQLLLLTYKLLDRGHVHQALPAAAGFGSAANGLDTAAQQQEAQELRFMYRKLTGKEKTAANSALTAQAREADRLAAGGAEGLPCVSDRQVGTADNAGKLVRQFCPAAAALLVLTRATAGHLHDLPVEDDRPPRWQYLAGVPVQEAHLLTCSGLAAACRPLAGCLQLQVGMQAAADRVAPASRPGSGLLEFFWTCLQLLQQEAEAGVVQPAGSVLTAGEYFKQAVMGRVNAAKLLLLVYGLLKRGRLQEPAQQGLDTAAAAVVPAGAATAGAAAPGANTATVSPDPGPPQQPAAAAGAARAAGANRAAPPPAPAATALLAAGSAGAGLPQQRQQQQQPIVLQPLSADGVAAANAALNAAAAMAAAAAIQQPQHQAAAAAAGVTILASGHSMQQLVRKFIPAVDALLAVTRQDCAKLHDAYPGLDGSCPMGYSKGVLHETMLTSAKGIKYALNSSAVKYTSMYKQLLVPMPELGQPGNTGSSSIGLRGWFKAAHAVFVQEFHAPAVPLAPEAQKGNFNPSQQLMQQVFARVQVGELLILAYNLLLRGRLQDECSVPAPTAAAAAQDHSGIGEGGGSMNEQARAQHQQQQQRQQTLQPAELLQQQQQLLLTPGVRAAAEWSLSKACAGAGRASLRGIGKPFNVAPAEQMHRLVERLCPQLPALLALTHSNAGQLNNRQLSVRNGAKWEGSSPAELQLEQLWNKSGLRAACSPIKPPHIFEQLDAAVDTAAAGSYVAGGRSGLYGWFWQAHTLFVHEMQAPLTLAADQAGNPTAPLDEALRQVVLSRAYWAALLVLVFNVLHVGSCVTEQLLEGVRVAAVAAGAPLFVLPPLPPHPAAAGGAAAGDGVGGPNGMVPPAAAGAAAGGGMLAVPQSGVGGGGGVPLSNAAAGAAAQGGATAAPTTTAIGREAHATITDVGSPQELAATATSGRAPAAAAAAAAGGGAAAGAGAAPAPPVQAARQQQQQQASPAAGRQAPRQQLQEISTAAPSAAALARAGRDMAAAASRAASSFAAAAAASQRLPFIRRAGGLYNNYLVLAGASTAASFLRLHVPGAAALSSLRKASSAPALHVLPITADRPPRWSYQQGTEVQEAQLLDESGLRAACSQQQPQVLRRRLSAAVETTLRNGSGLQGWFWAAHALFIEECGTEACCPPKQNGVDAAAALRECVQGRARFARLLIMTYNLLLRGHVQDGAAAAGARRGPE